LGFSHLLYLYPGVFLSFCLYTLGVLPSLCIFRLGILPSLCIFLGFSHLYVYLWDFSTCLYISMGCYVSIIYIYVHSLIFS
jgi:hypothetical protein